MNMRDQILLISDLYGLGLGVGRKRVSTLVFNRGSKIDDIERGGDLTTGNFERAIEWFDLNWPAKVAWPDAVTRPLYVKEAAQ